MAIRTHQEQLQKFDELVAHFTADPKRRTDPRKNGADRNFIEPDGRRDMSSMLQTVAETMIINDYINNPARLEDAKLAQAVSKRCNKEWGQSLVLILAYLHDDDRCWTASGFSDFGQDAADVYRHLLMMGCINDDEFKQVAVKALGLRGGFQSMHDYVLMYARAQALAHPIITEHHDIGNAG
jgi:hypothetical protein